MPNLLPELEALIKIDLLLEIAGCALQEIKSAYLLPQLGDAIHSAPLSHSHLPDS